LILSKKLFDFKKRFTKKKGGGTAANMDKLNKKISSFKDAHQLIKF